MADSFVSVRREAALSLAWCGGRDEVEALLQTLKDDHWSVAQAAWVALNNITGMTFPFNALAESSIRNHQMDTWRHWWESAVKQWPPSDAMKLLESEDLESRLRGVRALGALGGQGAVEAISKVLHPYLQKNYNNCTSLDKNIILSGLRSLGRLRNPGSLSILLEFLDTVEWARYAADALGEFGDRKAIAPLIEVFPRFALDLRYVHTVNPMTVKPSAIPPDDRPTNSPIDRMYETPFAILSAIIRLPLDNQNDLKALRKIAFSSSTVVIQPAAISRLMYSESDLGIRSEMTFCHKSIAPALVIMLFTIDFPSDSTLPMNDIFYFLKRTQNLFSSGKFSCRRVNLLVIFLTSV